MSATSSRLPLLAAAAACALACTEREIDTHPFHVAATFSGVEVTTGEYEGTATVDEPGTTLTVTGADGVLVLTFDAEGKTGVRFPDDLQGRNVAVELFGDSAAAAPDGSALPIPGFRVLRANDAGGLEFWFFLGEGMYSRNDLPLVSPAFSQSPATLGAYPALTVIAPNLYFEPADCGLVYYDELRVVAGAQQDLPRDTEERVQHGSPPIEWNVHHVLSWHRTGDCPGKPKTWMQAAMWRS